MAILGLLVLIAGLIISLIGGIWFLVVAFRESILWGLGCIFIPFVSLFFLIIHWKDASKPFFVSLLGNGIILASIFLMKGSN